MLNNDEILCYNGGTWQKVEKLSLQATLNLSCSKIGIFSWPQSDCRFRLGGHKLNKMVS